jgi:hypothetical protein
MQVAMGTNLEHVTADKYGRITLPKQFSDRLSWLTGSDEIQGWLLLLSLGRFRILSDEQVQNDPLLEPVRSLVLEGKPEVTAEPTHADNPKSALIVARLLRAPIKPKQGWRISFPSAFDVFKPSGCNDKAFSLLFSLDGYLEIWYTDIVRKIGVLPLYGEQELPEG